MKMKVNVEHRLDEDGDTDQTDSCCLSSSDLIMENTDKNENTDWMTGGIFDNHGVQII